ncbi:MAG TPA: carboxyl transferase domain-containing protein [Acidimicrobiales bacterium]|nr:carboxyl transferase domain-containing protein [Acidimicrobiales bacterium]
MADAGVVHLRSPLVGTIVTVMAPGASVSPDTVVALVESMKMEYPVLAGHHGIVGSVAVGIGDAVDAGTVLVELHRAAAAAAPPAAAGTPSVAGEPDRLAELKERTRLLGDAARLDAVAKRHGRGLRTARENVADLIDPDSFIEYGRFTYAAQTRRRSLEDLIAKTPGDGLVCGTATVAGTPVAVLSYDAMVLAGTQGQRNHQKKDRLFDLVMRQGLPVVFFTEGGGGRPGDTDNHVVTGLNTEAFHAFASLSGAVRTIGIAAGRCFAGNAALFGCCDVAVAVDGATIGMGGPAMIEGGGLGVVEPEAVGPVAVHQQAGSVDLLARDEAHAVELTKLLLALDTRQPAADDHQRSEALRHVLPTDRRRAYDVRGLLDVVVDPGSLLELRPGFGGAIVTAFGRLAGRPVAVVANNPGVNAGAIDAPAADKAARFLQLADAWGLPVVSFVDTPGFMVGPETEATGLVRHAGRLFVAGAALRVPMVAVVTRRGYGLGAQAMCGGSFTTPLLTVAWPQAELGGMGLEGAVRLGFRAELDAIADPTERATAEGRMIAAAYEQGRALNVAGHLEIDDVIDPDDTRRLVVATLDRAPARLPGVGRRRFVDPF